MTASRRTASQASAVVQARVAVVTCGCGLFPLERAMHRTSRQAWQAAADHVALNPTKCKPALFWDLAPAGLAATLPTA